MQKNGLKRKALSLALLTILGTASNSVFSANEKIPVFNRPQALNGWRPEQGSQYLYKNVYANTDAIITVEHVPNGEKIKVFDMDNTGELRNFQPRIDHHGGSVLFSIAFFKAGTKTPAEKAEYCMTSIDMDNYEFVGFEDSADLSYIDSNTTKLQAYAGAGAGYTDGYIPKKPFNLAGVGLEKTATASVRYISTNKIMFRLGSKNWPGSFKKPWWGNNNMVRSMHAITFSACDILSVPKPKQPAASSASCAGDLSWKNKGAAKFIHWGVEHKMIHEDDHKIFDSSSLPASLTNPPAAGTEVTVNLGSWEDRTPNRHDGWQPGEQINVVFLDAADNIIWRSGFTDDLPDISPSSHVSASITESVTITQAVDKVYIAHKSHSKYNQKLDWIGSVYPDYLCLDINDAPPPPPPPALDFGSEGRFNLRELNTHKVEEHRNGGGGVDN